MGALLDTFEQKVTWETCCRAGCGVQWGMTAGFVAERRRDRTMFHCPNGHAQFYPGGTSDQQQIAALKAAVERERESRNYAESRAAQIERSRNAYRGVATRVRKRLVSTETRIRAGVCPHCNRTFKQLAEHMKCKHAGMADSSICPNVAQIDS